MEEKYISFIKHVDSIKNKNEKNFQKNCVKLRFIDSFKFLNTSLDKLTSYLDKDKLKIVRSKFCKLSAEDFDHEKVSFCTNTLKYCRTRAYHRANYFSVDRFVSESDFAHAASVWQRFSIRTFSEYSDLYLKTNILLLCHFQKFPRKLHRELWSRSRALLRFLFSHGTLC